MTIYLSLVAPDAPTTKTYGEGEDAITINVPESTRDCVQEPCLVDGKTHDKVWSVTRRVQPWGHFVTAVINRRREVIDGSLPHVVTKLPKDAIALTPEEAARVWHEDNESHVFGGPNVAKALRESIKRHNEEVTRG